jgi:hypothetical protein
MPPGRARESINVQRHLDGIKPETELAERFDFWASVPQCGMATNQPSGAMVSGNVIR